MIETFNDDIFQAVDLAQVVQKRFSKLNVSSAGGVVEEAALFVLFGAKFCPEVSQPIKSLQTSTEF